MDGLTNRLDISVLAGRLRDLREGRGLDQEAVADRAGLSSAYISRLERGAVPNPKVFDLEKVADALDVPVARLLDRTAEGRTLAFSSDLDEIKAEVADLPDDLARQVIEAFRQTMALTRSARREHTN